LFKIKPEATELICCEPGDPLVGRATTTTNTC